MCESWVRDPLCCPNCPSTGIRICARRDSTSERRGGGKGGGGGGIKLAMACVRIFLPLSRQTIPPRWGGISGVNQSENTLFMFEFLGADNLCDQRSHEHTPKKSLFFYYTSPRLGQEAIGNKHIPTFALKQDSSLATSKCESQDSFQKRIGFRLHSHPWGN